MNEKKFQPPQPIYPEIYSDSKDVLAPSPAVAEQEAENQRRLLATIEEATANGKEIFNYVEFTKIYWLKDIQNDGLSGNESQEVVDEFIWQYYMRYPDTKTMAKFAEALELRDMQTDQ